MANEIIHLHVDEDEFLNVDFTDQLEAGEVLTLQEFHFEDTSGADVSASWGAHGAAVSGAKVEYWAKPTVAGRFSVYCRVITNTNRVLVSQYSNGREGPVIIVGE